MITGKMERDRRENCDHDVDALLQKERNYMTVPSSKSHAMVWCDDCKVWIPFEWQDKGAHMTVARLPNAGSVEEAEVSTLVDRLRDPAYLTPWQLRNETADAIEKLEAENARLCAENTEMARQLGITEQLDKWRIVLGDKS
jgi:hypothetical protein